MTDWLVDTLIATSGLMLLVLVLREPVRTRFGAAAAYGLWLIPAARVLMPTLTTTVERAVPATLPSALPNAPVTQAFALMLKHAVIVASAITRIAVHSGSRPAIATPR